MSPVIYNAPEITMITHTKSVMFRTCPHHFMNSFWGYPKIKPWGGHVNYHKIVMTSPLATVPWNPQNNKKQKLTGSSRGSAVVTDKQLKLLRHMTSQAWLLGMQRS